MTEPTYTEPTWVDVPEGTTPPPDAVPISAANLTAYVTHAIKQAIDRAVASLRYDAAQGLTPSQRAVGRSNLALGTIATADAGDFAPLTAPPISLAKYGVKPGAGAATNVAGFAAAAADAQAGVYSHFTLPPGDYAIQLTEGGASLFSVSGLSNIKIEGKNARLVDTTAYTHQGVFTPIFLFDNCTNVEVDLDYTGPTLATPTVELGYQGGIFVRAVNGCDGVRVRGKLANLRYGVQSGEYIDPSLGGCRNIDVKLRTSFVGYPIATYLANGIRLDIDADSVHRAAYIAGGDDVRGVIRFKDQYIADVVCLLTDAKATVTDPVTMAGTSVGCTNVDVVVVDKGSTVFQPSSTLCAIALSRVDPCLFRNIRARVYSAGTDTISTTMAAFKIYSGAKTVPGRTEVYPYNWESTIVLDNIEVSGIVDHSAATLAGNTGSEFYVLAYDTSTAHAATIRNFSAKDLIILPSSAASPRQSYFYAPGLATPARFERFITPGLRLGIFTNLTYVTHLDNCVMDELDLPGVGGGSPVALGPGTQIAKPMVFQSATAVTANGAKVGGAGPAIRQKEVVLTLAGASVSWAGAIPTGATVLAMQTRIQTTIAGATGYQVGVAADATRYANTNNLTAGQTTGVANFATTETAPRNYFATTDIVVTAKTSNFTGGSLRVILTYYDFGTPNA